MEYDYWQKMEEGKFYHIYNRATLDLKLFKEKSDYDGFLSSFRKYFGPYLETIAFCLIPNHFHFLCRVKTLEEVMDTLLLEDTKAAQFVLSEEKPFNDFLVDQARRLFSSYSLKHKNKYDRRGNLFSERFKRVQVHGDARLLYMICYIHHNPIHHHLVSNYTFWDYSSYKHYLSKKESFIKKDMILEWLGGLDILLKHHVDFELVQKEPLNFDQNS